MTCHELLKRAFDLYRAWSLDVDTFKYQFKTKVTEHLDHRCNCLEPSTDKSKSPGDVIVAALAHVYQDLSHLPWDITVEHMFQLVHKWSSGSLDYDKVMKHVDNQCNCVEPFTCRLNSSEDVAVIIHAYNQLACYLDTAVFWCLNLRCHELCTRLTKEKIENQEEEEKWRRKVKWSFCRHRYCCR